MLRKLALVLLLGLMPAAGARAHSSEPTAGSFSARSGKKKHRKARGKQRATHAKGRRRKGTRQEGSRRASRKLRRGTLVARRAASLVGVPLAQASTRVPDDCTGLARLAYQRIGVDLMGSGQPGDNGVTAIYRRAEARKALHHRMPRPGDLVFFRETYDRNGDGLRNDGLTHIGVVESVDADGTITFIHRGGGGVKRSRMNLSCPDRHGGRREGILNDYLRRATDSDRAYLTGELFAGYASAGRM